MLGAGVDGRPVASTVDACVGLRSEVGRPDVGDEVDPCEVTEPQRFLEAFVPWVVELCLAALVAAGAADVQLLPVLLVATTLLLDCSVAF